MFSCGSACRPGNPAAGFVHVDTSLIMMEAELRADEEAQRKDRERAEQLAWERAEEQRLEEEAEAKRLVEEARVREEQARLEEQKRIKEQARLEEERLRLEEEQRKEAERMALEEEQRQRKEALDLFYQQHGFAGVNEPRRSGCAVWAAATTYPIHCAAELADERIVEMLLKEGAVRSQKNSAGMTAAQVAQRKNRRFSHYGVLRLLVDGKVPRRGGA